MWKLLRTRHLFRRLWGADLVSLLGDWLRLVAISHLTVKGGAEATGLALVLLAHTLPMAVASPLAEVLVDRFDRKKLLFGANLVQGALTLVVAGAAFAEAVAWLPPLVLARGLV